MKISIAQFHWCNPGLRLQGLNNNKQISVQMKTLVLNLKDWKELKFCVYSNFIAIWYRQGFESRPGWEPAVEL